MYCKTELFSLFCLLFQCLYLLCFFFEPHPPRHFSISANYQQVYSITDPSWSNYNTLLHVPLIPFPIILSVSLPLSFFWLSHLSLSLSLPPLPRTLSGSQILKIEIWRMVLLEASIQGYHSQSNEDTPLARGGRRAPCPHSSICECEWVLHFVYLCSRVLSRQ